MKRHLPLLISVLLCTISLLSVMLLIYSIQEENNYKHPENLTSVQFIGTYQASPSDLPRDLTSETYINGAEVPSLILTGHFDHEIQDNEQLLFRLNNVRFKIYINGREYFSYGEKGTYPSFVKSPGNIWIGVMFPHITLQDEIKIELSSIYHNNLSISYNNFYHQIYKGDSGALFQFLLKNNFTKIFLGFFVVLFGMMLLGALMLLKILKTPISPAPFYLAFFTIVSGIWVLIDFNLISLIIPYGLFTNILDVICLSLAPLLLVLYMLNFVTGNSRYFLFAVAYSLLGFLLFFILTQGCGILDGYELLTPLCILLGISSIVAFFCLLHEIRHNSNKTTKFILQSCCLCFLGAGDVVNYFLQIIPFNIWFITGFLLFMITQFIFIVRYLHKSINNAYLTRQLESELAQSRIAIALSQIQPHFLYNSLTAIKQLCAIDPIRAEKAVGDFASFLRGNLDSLSSSAPIPFEKELNHIKNYLSLEQLRFGRRLRIVYDIHANGFLIPSLTVQPLVENSVRYGVTKKINGGTVTISTKETENAFIVTISDDGIGFDPYKKQDDGRTHIGIENVRKRLYSQGGSHLSITSIPKEGTTAVITIYKGATEK